MKEHDSATLEQTAARVVETLEQGTRELDAKTLSGLYDGRRQALAALHARHVGGGVLALQRHPALWGLGLASALLILAWLAMQPAGPQRPAAMPDTSDLDIQLLTGELPPQVFADWSLVTKENVEAVCLTDS